MIEFPSSDLHHDHIHTSTIATNSLCATCAATGAWVRAKRLMTRSEVDHYFSMSHEHVQSLINTRQITVIRIKGEDRFDSRDLDLLIETYKQTARRRS